MLLLDVGRDLLLDMINSNQRNFLLDDQVRGNASCGFIERRTTKEAKTVQVKISEELMQEMGV